MWDCKLTADFVIGYQCPLLCYVYCSLCCAVTFPSRENYVTEKMATTGIVLCALCSVHFSDKLRLVSPYNISQQLMYVWNGFVDYWSFVVSLRIMTCKWCDRRRGRRRLVSWWVAPRNRATCVVRTVGSRLFADGTSEQADPGPQLSCCLRPAASRHRGNCHGTSTPCRHRLNPLKCRGLR